MNIDLRRTDDVIIVDLDGKLVRGDGAEMLSEAMNELFGGPWKKILLNLSQVTHLDSSGVGELVASLKTCHKLGIDLRVLRLPSRVERTLRLSQILPLFEIHRDEQEALASF